jgi:hypothetical protein
MMITSVRQAAIPSARDAGLEYFQESCPKSCLEDLDRKDLLKFTAFLAPYM